MTGSVFLRQESGRPGGPVLFFLESRVQMRYNTVYMAASLAEIRAQGRKTALFEKRIDALLL
ncbi:hypothetical protein DLM86_10180 [Paenibacillus flagellatus]|uniref:Uncharacterized protein n=1 Tax=Paenibacillus flagellatus TaxID=2211139 RepID=A0A2V5K685_9BACL|nr:hypothetical protein DLM86_10180 [Paenibacillus flagellatus]